MSDLVPGQGSGAECFGGQEALRPLAHPGCGNAVVDSTPGVAAFALVDHDAAIKGDAMAHGMATPIHPVRWLG